MTAQNNTSKYEELRVALLRKKTSIRAWAIKYRKSVPLAYNAARGERKGPAAKELVKEMEEFAYGK